MGSLDEKRSHDATDWKEGRRLRAWELSQAGWSQAAIAEALGVTPGAISQWLSRAKEGGVAALYKSKTPGPKPRLSAEQRARLPELLARGAEAYAFRGDIWTRSRVAEVIWRESGVRHTPTHVGRILRDCGWSLQKPIRRACQRDEEAIRRWQEERWPEVKKRRIRRSNAGVG
jgi:transposase